MTAVVSTFLDTELGKGKYLFFLVTFTDFESKLTAELEKQWLPFGSALGVDGTAVRAYFKRENQTFDEVQKKSWPSEVCDQMAKEQDPYMLIIDKPFYQFDPTKHKWGIVWFSKFFEHPQEIYRMFGSLAKKVKEGEDIFEWAASLTKKQKYGKLTKYFDVKPGIFGFTVDIKSALKDLAGINQ
ncbi:hypothetical protein SAMN05444161_0406 [Rhizobiales bacterium GAS191]|nr:hypothetical protein SAMN05519103_07895 [Rhizobiales bacterium GAS113]SEC05263.1 hypothetical protein SAMN05444161_0406 [Rhizobiales bacterium GAS191]